jgi:hypothetical protein
VLHAVWDGDPDDDAFAYSLDHVIAFCLEGDRFEPSPITAREGLVRLSAVDVLDDGGFFEGSFLIRPGEGADDRIASCKRQFEALVKRARAEKAKSAAAE